MTWPANVERWRQYVLWECKDIPPDLVLSIINHESGGLPGLKSTGTTAANVEISGSPGKVNRALGLMQCTSVTVQWYNDKGRGTGEPVTYDDMTGSSERACRQQIRVGCALYAAQVAQLHRFDPSTFPSRSAANATPDQLKFALVAYAIGGGWQADGPDGKGLKPRLIGLQNAGLPLTFQNLASYNPLWGKSPDPERGWINRPIQMARNTYSHFEVNARNANGAPGGPAAPGSPGKLAKVGTPSAPQPWHAMTQIGGEKVNGEGVTDFLKNNWWILLALVAALFMNTRKEQVGGLFGSGDQVGGSQ